MKKSKMYKFISKTYNEFKIFIEADTLPDIEIELFAEDNNVYAFFDTDELSVKEYKIHVNHKLFDCHERYVRSILFHEFTHLYDHIVLEDVFDNDELASMTDYTEYHASQIEMLSQLYTDIKDIKVKKKASSTIWYANNNVDINHYLIYPLVDMATITQQDINVMSNLNSNKFAKRFVRAKTCAVYYFAKLDVCSKYIDGTIIDLFTPEYPFFEDFNELHNILNNNTLGLKQKAYRLKVWNGYFRNKFIKHYIKK